MCRPYNPSETVRATPIRIVGVVVVDVATVVDIPRIVGVATIAGSQPHVDSRGERYSLQPVFIKSDIFISVFILLVPSLQSEPQITGHFAPVLHLLIAEMEMLSAKLNLCKMLTT